ncbi:YbjQ family protein [Sphingomonas sp. RHCKR7]|uniref:heavy metal-binding domain-containing protein n=1 Tax=Sphingomonas folli TaxID=2862497 RepID=UPI001C676D31|nr:heavy metal-binding domain-containing protein [Sphingomonas folli]MBW6528477.1 YbjQ family protein [Sphingomonas folli]
MSDDCGNCGTRITPGTAFKTANDRKSERLVALVNLVQGTTFTELCARCGDAVIAQVHKGIDGELAERSRFVEARIADFPMMTLSWLPARADVRLKNMVTANVTVGTGFFSEFSQGFSDFAGAVNVNSGMSFKVNKGEAAARSILVAKALALGANCVLGVDIDYGTTGNNAATVNMQGTAAVIKNLDEVLDEDVYARAEELGQAFGRIAQLKRLRAGQIEF